MIMTEDEAREKWCPMARVCASKTDAVDCPHHTGWNRLHVSDESESWKNPNIARCIASDCVMWRWTHAGMVLEVDKKGPLLRNQNAGEPMRGYYGLAGKP